MEQQFIKEQQRILANKNVAKISKFYKCLMSYFIVNIFLSIIFVINDISEGNLFLETLWNYHNYKIWLYWGVGILLKAINIFGLPISFNKNWEQKKINEYLEKIK
jgi:hypothetical protein